MKEAFGHKVTYESTKKKRKVREPNTVLPRTDLLDWMQQKQTFTVLELSRRFLLNPVSVGNILRSYAAKGVIEQLPRGHKEEGVWKYIF